MACPKRRPSARSGIGLESFNRRPLSFRQFQGGFALPEPPLQGLPLEIEEHAS